MARVGRELGSVAARTVGDLDLNHIEGTNNHKQQGETSYPWWQDLLESVPSKVEWSIRAHCDDDCVEELAENQLYVFEGALL